MALISCTGLCGRAGNCETYQKAIEYLIKDPTGPWGAVVNSCRNDTPEEMAQYGTIEEAKLPFKGGLEEIN